MFSLFDFALAYALFLLAAIAWCVGAAGMSSSRRTNDRNQSRGASAIGTATRRL